MDKDMGKSAGADDYLVKPFKSADLISRIERLLTESKING